MAVGFGIRRSYLILFLLLVVAVVVPVLIRFVTDTNGPQIELIFTDGRARTVTRAQMKRLPALTREGTYQNQFGNWGDPGIYTGVRLTDLIGSEAPYTTILVQAADGYEMSIERDRVENADYPMILAYAFNGVEVPAWKMGYRIAVLPEDGNVGNEEYGVTSAGSFWVKNVVRVILQLGS
ncbi:TPA: hypothetical protein DIT45_04975 [Candidatus Acetothermia bacterium]|nr:hypothetical protein [Candidatus Acetothermia bacterium]